MRIELPALHAGQKVVARSDARFRVLMSGRRWGKTTFGLVELACESLRGEPVAWFAPTYKYLLDPWRDLNSWLAPVVERSNAQEMRIDLSTGGSIDFWTMDSADPGRGRAYSLVAIDEAGIVRDLAGTFNSAIRPTLTDMRGRALMLGTPKGRRDFFRMFARGGSGDPTKGEDGWKSFRGRTADNPYVDPQEIADAKREYERAGLLAIYMQEYEAIPTDDEGNPFGAAAIARCVGPASQMTPEWIGVDLAKSVDWTVVCGLDTQGRVCMLERWQSDWRATKERICRLVGKGKALVDSTGVGDPIVEELGERLPNVQPFRFTSQSKQELMRGLVAAIQESRITFPDGWLREELETFEYQYSGASVRYSAPAGLHDDGVCALALAQRCRETFARSTFRYSVSA